MKLGACTGIVLSDARISVPEGLTSSYTVRLATTPNVPVTVTLSKTGDADITFDTDTDTPGNQNTLTFTATDWDTAQTVTLIAAHDTDNTNNSTTITHITTSTDSAYDNLTSTNIATEIDDEPRLITTNVTHNNAQLALVNHTGEWWLKRTAPTTGTCTHNTNTQKLVFLTPGNTYTYTAYSAANCATDNQINSTTFTALSGVLNLTAVTHNSATLYLGTYYGDWWLKRVSESGTCIQKNRDRTTNLTGLLPDTTYTYAAYSAYNCYPNDQITTVTFTTIGRTLTPSAVTHNSATLTLTSNITLTGYHGEWWLKRTAPTTGACTHQTNTDTQNLASLTPGIIYTYTAYSAANCHPGDQITTATFTTIGRTLIPSAVTHNSATLTLTGHYGDWWLKRTAPTTGTCTHKTAVSAQNLASLTPATAYTYTAYDNSSCNSRNELVSASFTTPGTALSTTRIIVPEAGTVAYTAALATAPAAPVTVTLINAGDADITLDTDTSTTGNQNTLTFTLTDWYIPQIITLTAAEETRNSDKTNGTATITHITTSTDITYNNTTTTLTATEGDNDTCQNTAAVNNTTTGTLVDDCNTLLAAKTMLTGTADTLGNWNTNTPISDWTDITTTNNGVIQINLPDLGLDGMIPNTIGTLAGLVSLDLSGNNLTGPIPPQLSSLSGLVSLDLSGNNLTGPIPPQLGSLSGLVSLDLSGNNLTGPIPPQLGNPNNLTTLNLADNNLTGPIPPQLGNPANLTTLNLADNNLTRPIPPQLGNPANLTTLNLSHNNLKETIPPQLGNPNNLTTLNLSGNNLTGPIPPQLGNPANLTTLNLSHNNLTRPIPPQLGNPANLTTLNLSHNNLKETIPPQLGNPANLRELYLHNNGLTGTIPSQLGNPANLTTLNLADNNLTGPIPPQLGNPANLTNST